MQFILRTIDPNGNQKNEVIGDSYSIIPQDSPDFMGWSMNFKSDNIDSFVVCDKTGNVIPLVYGNHYYIMGDNGKTFDSFSLFSE